MCTNKLTYFCQKTFTYFFHNLYILCTNITKFQHEKSLPSVLDAKFNEATAYTDSILAKSRTCSFVSFSLMGQYFCTLSLEFKKIDSYCKLSYEIMDTFLHNHREFSILKIHAKTGRQHQIRAQLAHERIPIIGDWKYKCNINFVTEYEDIFIVGATVFKIL